ALPGGTKPRRCRRRRRRTRRRGREDARRDRRNKDRRRGPRWGDPRHRRGRSPPPQPTQRARRDARPLGRAQVGRSSLLRSLPYDLVELLEPALLIEQEVADVVGDVRIVAIVELVST